MTPSTHTQITQDSTPASTNSNTHSPGQKRVKRLGLIGEVSMLVIWSSLFSKLVFFNHYSRLNRTIKLALGMLYISNL